MGRTDFYHQPDAPTPNSLVVAVTAFVDDGRGHTLLIRRTDSGLWALPGGAVDFGEDVAAAAGRETAEETGIEITTVGIVGIYSDPRHVIAYDDGEVRQEFSICLRAKPTGGELRTSNESSAVDWVSRDQLRDLAIHPAMRLRLEHGFDQTAAPYIG